MERRRQILVADKLLVHRWYTAGKSEGLSTDVDVAQFLLSLYFDGASSKKESDSLCVHCLKPTTPVCDSCREGRRKGKWDKKRRQAAQTTKTSDSVSSDLLQGSVDSNSDTGDSNSDTGDSDSAENGQRNDEKDNRRKRIRSGSGHNAVSLSSRRHPDSHYESRSVSESRSPSCGVTSKVEMRADSNVTDCGINSGKYTKVNDCGIRRGKSTEVKQEQETEFAKLDVDAVDLRLHCPDTSGRLLDADAGQMLTLNESETRCVSVESMAHSSVLPSHFDDGVLNIKSEGLDSDLNSQHDVLNVETEVQNVLNIQAENQHDVLIPQAKNRHQEHFLNVNGIVKESESSHDTSLAVMNKPNKTFSRKKKTGGRKQKKQTSTESESSHDASLAVINKPNNTFSTKKMTDGKKQKKQTSTASKMFECELCCKWFASAYYLKRHKSVHSGLSPHVCQVCRQAFTTAASLRNHRQLHAEQHPVACPTCGITFSQTKQLRRHVRQTHSGSQCCVCEVCSKSFSSQSYLKAHMALHTGQTPHVCDMCNKSFTLASSLQKHKVIHSGAKPHLCDLCGLGFTQKGSLNIHRQIHIGTGK